MSTEATDTAGVQEVDMDEFLAQLDEDAEQAKEYESNGYMMYMVGLGSFATAVVCGWAVYASI
ncbi:MAG: hypothetical protein CMK92_03845 [Pseudomonas sp.]|nr:hypothetical protein [Pseudomonas sp.]